MRRMARSHRMRYAPARFLDHARLR